MVPELDTFLFSFDHGVALALSLAASPLMG